MLHPMYRNEPVNTDGTNDFNISTLTLGAQQGSFTFTVNEDGIAEGREIVMLTLADTGDNLPEGWTLDNSNPYYILIEANDNAARFAEWPRENPGGEASLNLTIEEEDDPATAEKENEGTVVVLLTSLFPPEPGLSSLPFAIRVSSEHNQDVDFEVIDGDPLTGGGPTRFIRQSGNIHFFFVRYFPALRVAGMRPNGTPASEPYLAARLKIRAVNDSTTEGNETVTLTLLQPSNFPKSWGSVTALPDIGYHIGQNPVETSTTVTITIPANDEPSSSPSPPPNPSGFGRGFQREAQAH